MKYLVVGEDIKPDEILMYCDDPNVKVVFDPQNLPKLDKKALQLMPPDVRSAYLSAQEVVKEQEFEELVRGIDLRGSAVHVRKLKARQRPGWHQYWASPDEVEDKMVMGYRVVRRPTKEQIEHGYRPGQEKGPPIVVKGENGEDELVLMEVPEKIYQAVLTKMAVESRERYETNRESFLVSVDKTNSMAGRQVVRPVEETFE